MYTVQKVLRQTYSLLTSSMQEHQLPEKVEVHFADEWDYDRSLHRGIMVHQSYAVGRIGDRTWCLSYGQGCVHGPYAFTCWLVAAIPRRGKSGSFAQSLRGNFQVALILGLHDGLLLIPGQGRMADQYKKGLPYEPYDHLRSLLHDNCQEACEECLWHGHNCAICSASWHHDDRKSFLSPDGLYNPAFPPILAEAIRQAIKKTRIKA